MFLILILAPLINSFNPSDGITTDFKIIHYNSISKNSKPLEYNVVGDSFYYNLSFLANEDISNEIIKVYVYSANKEKIWEEDILIKNLKKGERISHIPNASIGEGYLALPFDLSGDYEIKVCSEKNYALYKTFWVREGIYAHPNSNIRYSPCYRYFFSVMSQSDYELFEEEKNINKQTLKNANNMLDLTWGIIFLTIINLVITIINSQKIKL